MGNALKFFMLETFDYTVFKKAGIYPKHMKHNDYKGQAAIICKRLNLKSIYDYGQHQIRCLLTEDSPKLSVDEKGELKTQPFIPLPFPNQLHN